METRVALPEGDIGLFKPQRPGDILFRWAMATGRLWQRETMQGLLIDTAMIAGNRATLEQRVKTFKRRVSY